MRRQTADDRRKTRSHRRRTTLERRLSASRISLSVQRPRCRAARAQLHRVLPPRYARRSSAAHLRGVFGDQRPLCASQHIAAIGGKRARGGCRPLMRVLCQATLATFAAMLLTAPLMAAADTRSHILFASQRPAGTCALHSARSAAAVGSMRAFSAPRASFCCGRRRRRWRRRRRRRHARARFTMTPSGERSQSAATEISIARRRRSFADASGRHEHLRACRSCSFRAAARRPLAVRSPACTSSADGLHDERTN